MGIFWARAAGPRLGARLARQASEWFCAAGRPAAAPPYAPRGDNRRLHFEPLEVRHLLEAAGLAALVSPMWFQQVSNGGPAAQTGGGALSAESTAISAAAGSTPSAAPPPGNVYDWIVQFTAASLVGIGSVAQTQSLMWGPGQLAACSTKGGGVDFQVLKGLGLAGQVLVRSSGASLATTEDCLQHNTNLESFEEDAVGQVTAMPNDPLDGNLWALSSVDAQAAWNITTGSSKVVVAVIDTGVDYNDPDLAANMWTNPYAGQDGFSGDVHGYNFVAGNGNPMDDNDHGTVVAGIIGAVGNNSIGVTGVDWSVSIMALKFMNADGTGNLSDAIAAMNYATMMRTRYGVNVRVDNCSWGGSQDSPALQTAIQAANSAGILVVVAAGNSGANNDAVAEYPADIQSPNVIAVAALTQNGQLASFSNYGATSVAIAAPGVSILSTVPGDAYAVYSGTSMAAPEVSGVAALAWALDPNASVAAVRSAILEGADPDAALKGKVACGGSLDAYKTLELLGGKPPSGPTTGPAKGGGGATVTTPPAPTNANAPVLAPIAGQTMSAGQTSLSLTLSATDPSGGRLQWSAKAMTNQAGSSALVPMTGTNVAVSTAGNRLVINRVPGYSREFWVAVTVTDGKNAVSETFSVSVATAAAMAAKDLSYDPAPAGRNPSPPSAVGWLLATTDRAAGSAGLDDAWLQATTLPTQGATEGPDTLARSASEGPDTVTRSVSEGPANLGDQTGAAIHDRALADLFEDLNADSGDDPGPDAGLAPLARGAAGPAVLAADFDGLSLGLSASNLGT